MDTLVTDFIFKDTGITVKIRKVSPLLASDISASIPEPEPPVQEVEYPGGVVMEPNYQHPDYVRAQRERTEKVVSAIQRAMISRGVIVEGEEWKAEVAAYRKDIRDFTGKDVEGTDLEIYVLRICVGTEEDLQDLLSALTKRSQPTESEVNSAKKSFRS